MRNKELEAGKIKISDDVYATIVTLATLETKGVHSMSSIFNDGVSTFFGVKHEYEGVKISFSDTDAISVTAYICVKYGYRIPDVALRLQEHIKTALVDSTQIEVETIDIVVQEVIFEDI
ncbi:MAG: Asp23/Gls24 family envelope stress response protein [Veillonella sp.]|nr:Asp23/Gls24 family envelope stress response protein [Veillonella sp.]